MLVLLIQGILEEHLTVTLQMPLLVTCMLVGPARLS